MWVQVQHRTAAVELAGALLTELEDPFNFDETAASEPQKGQVSTGCVCLAIVIQRMQDKSPGRIADTKK